MPNPQISFSEVYKKLPKKIQDKIGVETTRLRINEAAYSYTLKAEKDEALIQKILLYCYPLGLLMQKT